MKRKELKDKTAAVKGETKDALQTMFDALNHGQQKNETLHHLHKLQALRNGFAL